MSSFFIYDSFDFIKNRTILSGDPFPAYKFRFGIKRFIDIDTFVSFGQLFEETRSILNRGRKYKIERVQFGIPRVPILPPNFFQRRIGATFPGPQRNLFFIVPEHVLISVGPTWSGGVVNLLQG